MTSDENLIERCIALEKLIEAIKPFYSAESTSENQKALLETIVGAAIWYFPHGKNYWNNKVSKSAIEQFKQNPTASLTRDHIYPRKASGKKLLTENLGLNGEGFNLFCLYQNELAAYVLVTPQENRRLIKIQKSHKYGDWEEAYKKAEIDLIDFSELIKIEDPIFVKKLKGKS
jgi:hypothetical protein